MGDSASVTVGTGESGNVIERVHIGDVLNREWNLLSTVIVNEPGLADGRCLGNKITRR